MHLSDQKASRVGVTSQRDAALLLRWLPRLPAQAPRLPHLLLLLPCLLPPLLLVLLLVLLLLPGRAGCSRGASTSLPAAAAAATGR